MYTKEFGQNLLQGVFCVDREIEHPIYFEYDK